MIHCISIIKILINNCIKKPPRRDWFSEIACEYFCIFRNCCNKKKALDSLDYWFDNRFQVIEEYDLLVRIVLLGNLIMLMKFFRCGEFMIKAGHGKEVNYFLMKKN